MRGVQHFTELDCWLLANELKLLLLEISRQPLLRRDFKFYEQLRDAAASAPRNIAEGFGRRTHKDFAHFLDVARGSLNECQNHLRDCLERGYVTPDEFQRAMILSKRACGAVAGLQRYLRTHPDP